MKHSPKTPISNRGFDAQFLCMVPYNSPLVLDGVIASIDSVRIKYTYSKSGYDTSTKERFDTLTRLLYELTSESLWMLGEFDIDAGRETNFRIGNYMRTITYKLKDNSSFAVLVGRYCCDSSVKQVAPEIIMDFNPNKIPSKIWQRIASILASFAKKIEVQRFDLAVDLPIPRNQLQLVQRPGSGYQKFVSNSGAVTEYTGERSHHAAIKLYDKGADLGLDLACTRCEMTINPSKFKSVKAMWPTLLSLSPLELSIDFSELPYEVQSVILHPDLYNLLKSSVSRNTWPKYRKMIESYDKTYFTLTEDQVQQIDRYIRDYLLTLTSTGSTY